jgi:hypothetical protein
VTNKIITALAEAPKSVQLAVDLIQILEDNQIQVEVAVAALKIVLNDFENKRGSSQVEVADKDNSIVTAK